jgi:UDP-N-acetyl-D-mannosaminuronic acid transferase (WecB/TagA/CpsF family)
LANVKKISSETAFLLSLAPFGQAVSEEKIVLTVANQKTELLLVAMFVGQMEPYEEAWSQTWQEASI